MKKRTFYAGLVIFVVGLIILLVGLNEYDNAMQKDDYQEATELSGGDPEKYDSAVSFWSWFSSVGLILLLIGGIITLWGLLNIVKKMKIKNKFYLGLILIIIGIITNGIYYYYFSQGETITGIGGIFIRASSSLLFLFIYFVFGGWLVYKNKPSYWID